MKEASGELNMTVVTVVAIALILTLFTTVIYPIIKGGIVQKTCESYGDGYTASKENGSNCITADEEATWYCCENK